MVYVFDKRVDIDNTIADHNLGEVRERAWQDSRALNETTGSYISSVICSKPTEPAPGGDDTSIGVYFKSNGNPFTEADKERLQRFITARGGTLELWGEKYPDQPSAKGCYQIEFQRFVRTPSAHGDYHVFPQAIVEESPFLPKFIRPSPHTESYYLFNQNDKKQYDELYNAGGVLEERFRWFPFLVKRSTTLTQGEAVRVELYPHWIFGHDEKGYIDLRDRYSLKDPRVRETIDFITRELHRISQ